MRLVFAGTPEAAVPALRALHSSAQHEVLAVITRPDAPAGRGKRLARSAVADYAEAHGLELWKPESAGDPELLARLRTLAPDAGPVVAYGALLPRAALEIPRHGWINLHFSLLPAWRGAAPVQAAIRAGDEFAGASTFQMVPALDAGPVYGVLTEPLRGDDTTGTVLARLAEQGAELLLATLDGVAAGTVTAVPQREEESSYAEKLTPADAHVSFTDPARALDRLVRAVTPAPGAWTEFRGQRLKLGPLAPLNGAADTGSAGAAGGAAPSEAQRLAPGELHVGPGEVLAGTAAGAVRLGQVQPQGKAWMAARDWARGARIEQGERLQ